MSTTTTTTLLSSDDETVRRVREVMHGTLKDLADLAAELDARPSALLRMVEAATA